MSQQSEFGHFLDALKRLGIEYAIHWQPPKNEWQGAIFAQGFCVTALACNAVYVGDVAYLFSSGQPHWTGEDIGHGPAGALLFARTAEGAIKPRLLHLKDGPIPYSDDGPTGLAAMAKQYGFELPPQLPLDRAGWEIERHELQPGYYAYQCPGWSEPIPVKVRVGTGKQGFHREGWLVDFLSRSTPVSLSDVIASAKFRPINRDGALLEREVLREGYYTLTYAGREPMPVLILESVYSDNEGELMVDYLDGAFARALKNIPPDGEFRPL